MAGQTAKGTPGWGNSNSQTDESKGAPGWGQGKQFPSADELDSDPYVKHLNEVQNDPHRASTTPR